MEILILLVLFAINVLILSFVINIDGKYKDFDVVLKNIMISSKDAHIHHKLYIDNRECDLSTFFNTEEGHWVTALKCELDNRLYYYEVAKTKDDAIDNHTRILRGGLPKTRKLEKTFIDE